MTTLHPGTMIDTYRVTRHLGAGAMADVYEVWSPEGDARALKLLRAGLPRSKKAHDRMCDEAEATATVEHVNVVKYFGGGVFEGRLYLVLELVLGTNLRKLAEAAGGRLPVAQLVRIVQQVCEAVAAAHRKEIVHRDLTPENILVTPEGLAKVADFGSAKLAGWGVETTADQDVCTARYRSPEFARTCKAVTASDVFSIGVVLYELLSGRHPVTDERLSMAAMLTRLQSYRPPARLDSLGLGIPGDLSDLVQRALADAPEDRPSARAMADGLEAVFERLRVPHRDSARSLPRSKPDVAFARTEPVIRPVGPRGTTPMAAVSGADSSAARSTTLPPLPPEIPVTARPGVPERPVAATLAMPEVPAPLDRRTTGIPVEQAAPRPSAAAPDAASRSRVSRVAAVGAGILALGLGLGGAAWVWIGSGGPPPAPARAPLSPAPAPPPAPSSAAPAASSSAPLRAAPPVRKGPRSAPRP